MSFSTLLPVFYANKIVDYWVRNLTIVFCYLMQHGAIDRCMPHTLLLLLRAKQSLIDVIFSNVQKLVKKNSSIHGFADFFQMHKT